MMVDSKTTEVIHDIHHATNLSLKKFAGFKWPASPAYEPFRIRNQYFRDTMVNWASLCDIAQSLRQTDCHIEDRIGYGHSHMIRLIVFTDGVHWIARLPMPDINRNVEDKFLPKTHDYWSADNVLSMQSEIDTMSFISENSEIPIPKVYAYNTGTKNPVGAPYMFMECVLGNSIRHMGGIIPEKYKEKFYKDLARIHVSPITENALN
jgi:hypothetical protein